MLRITPIAALRDNYAYLIDTGDPAGVTVVDPSEAAPIFDALSRAHRGLARILCTHHHHDHVGGVEALADTYPGLEIVGSAHDGEARRIPRQNRSVLDDEVIDLGSGIGARALTVPGHTLGAVAYCVTDALFTGDTLFLAGCGRVFEGSLGMMFSSLERLSSLDDGTRVYCGHEYTARNLEFARSIEADNEEIAARLIAVQEVRARTEPSVPSTLGLERLTNPFLRTRAPTVRRWAAERGYDAEDPVAVFTALRSAKDSF